MIKGYKADVKLRADAKPVFKKSRPVAYALQPALDNEIQCLQQAGILKPVESSEWDMPLLVVPKTNGRLRVCTCGDYKVTIRVWKRKYIRYLATSEDLFTQLGRGRFSLSLICRRHTNSCPSMMTVKSY